ncbi:MAG: PAS domain S-box protein [Planctomycetaceae bacterium]|jgi:two-component system sensor kinase FixL
MAQHSQVKTDSSDGPQKFLADLAASEQRNRVAVDMTSEAIVGLNVDGMVQSWNPAAERLFGYRAQDISGNSILSLVPPERRQQMKSVYSTIRNATSVVNCETQKLTRDGQLLDVVLNVRPVTNAREDGPCALAVIRDVTELTRARKELRRRDAEALHASRLSAMGEMVAILVHEISQPLTVISAFAQTCISELRKETSSLDNLREPILQIDEQAKRSGSIIRSLKRFLARTAAPRCLVDLNDEIRAVCKLMRVQFDHLGTDVTLNLDDSLPPVLAEGLQIQQVLVNLLHNSLEAMSDTEPNSRPIVIASRARPDSVQVSVSDAGHGFRPDAAEKLFEPYFTTKDGGLGMGLTICERIISEHDGVLTAAWNEDTGTTFRFELPIANDESEPGPFSKSSSQ